MSLMAGTPLRACPESKGRRALYPDGGLAGTRRSGAPAVYEKAGAAEAAPAVGAIQVRTAVWWSAPAGTLDA